MTPEGAVVHGVLEYLAARGVYAWRVNTGRRGGVSFGRTGMADILGVLKDGRILAIECKAGKGKATLDQLVFLAEVAKRGGVAFVAYGIEDVAIHLGRGSHAVPS